MLQLIGGKPAFYQLHFPAQPKSGLSGDGGAGEILHRKVHAPFLQVPQRILQGVNPVLLQQRQHFSRADRISRLAGGKERLPGGLFKRKFQFHYSKKSSNPTPAPIL